MRLLFVSNQFPPDSRGGYENLCKEVATAFVERGHEVTVLTSVGLGSDAATEESSFPVQRVLHRELEGGLKSTVVKLLSDRKASEQENLVQIRRTVAEIKPDGVLIWGMWNMPRSVPAEFEQLLPARTAYYLCDYWPSLPSAYIQRWQEPARRRSAQLLKGLLGAYFLRQLQGEKPNQLQFKQVFTVSKALRAILVKKGIAINHAQVVYGGTQTEEYLAAGSTRTALAGQLRLIWIGRLEADKGLHTAIEALAQMNPDLLGAPIQQTEQPNEFAGTPDRFKSTVQVTLNIYGKGDPDYTQQVAELVARHKLNNTVKFCGVVPRQHIPTVLAQHDTLLFTSEWEEPFARSPLEALLVGLSVVSTMTGGSGEAMIDQQTALTYPAGDAAALARQIERLACDPNLSARLALAGKQMVVEQFSFERTVNQLETAMQAIVFGGSHFEF